MSYQYSLNYAGAPIYQAFSDYIKNLYPTTFVQFTINDGVTLFIEFNAPMDTDALTDLQTQVSAFVNPSYYLVFDHAENHCLATPTNLTITPLLMQTFIISPNLQQSGIGSSSSSLADMKTIAEIHIPDPSILDSLDPTITPITFTVSIYDLTRQTSITSVVTDISSVVEGWKAGTLSDPTYHSTQIYGLYGSLPDYDCVWQLFANVSVPGISITLNSMQKLYYQVFTS